ncbi:RNB domain-containing ribonuclease, partial [Streptobacillus moniliformis]
SNIPTSFSKDIRNEAIKIKRPVIEKELENRIDLRDKHTITIDDITAKDLDDAIYLEKDDNFYTLWVSIADVSHFVKENSLLDKEAF